jgi:hypothetical protein
MKCEDSSSQSGTGQSCLLYSIWKKFSDLKTNFEWVNRMKKIYFNAINAVLQRIWKVFSQVYLYFNKLKTFLW